ncbi:MAG TPA: AmmeMemoRadiSam system protein B [Anaeromyxobacteraceae bacterium]|nr:AmmeMemoRadiSam system protein B [Anaeromyxobacteraceae bacterium]
MIERHPAVAGRFYPESGALLAREVTSLLGDQRKPQTALGVLAPHAGYLYSGAVAGATYARVVVPERVLLLCPNHTGQGPFAALWPDGGWKTPLGPVPIDCELTGALATCPLVERDRTAHLNEHSLEVQLPFLKVLRPDLAIAALCLGPLSADEAIELGKAVAVALSAYPALLVASSDMSHYLSAEEARRRDECALERLLALNARGLHDTVREKDISMCGVVPATVMVAAAKQLGAQTAELVCYANSGDRTGDRRSVVGYAGVIVR